MMATMRAIPFVLLLLSSLPSCSRDDGGSTGTGTSTTSGANANDATFADEASRRAMAFQLALRLELTQAVQEGGAAKAIEVCSQRAQVIAASASSDTFRVRRVGTRLRNAANAMSERDRKALEALAARTAGDDAPLRVEGDGEIAASLYVPIRIAETCLQCHGDAAAMAADAKQALAQRYPSDQATGYALGDLRGAVVVDQKR